MSYSSLIDFIGIVYLINLTKQDINRAQTNAINDWIKDALNMIIYDE